MRALRWFPKASPAVHILNKTMNTADSNPTEPAPDRRPPAPELIQSLEQLAAMHDEPIRLTVMAYGRLLKFHGRRLQADEQQEVKRLLEQAIPPRGEDGRYNFEDESFLAQKGKYARQARAKCVALAFPELFKVPAEVTDLEALQKFIEARKISDELLEALYGAAALNVVNVVELAGFFSGNSSPKS